MAAGALERAPLTTTPHVVVYGEVDIATAGDLRARGGSAMGGPSTVIVVDVSGVTSIDCRGLRELLAVQSRLVSGGRRMLLHGPDVPVRSIASLAPDGPEKSHSVRD